MTAIASAALIAILVKFVPMRLVNLSIELSVERIVPVVRNDAHRLIEECMLAANVAAARQFLRKKLPAELIETVRGLGYRLVAPP
jgi:exoribonuclease II